MTYTRDAVILLLRKRQGTRTQTELATDIGVSKQYFSDVVSGRREPGPAILRYLGLVKTYAKKG